MLRRTLGSGLRIWVTLAALSMVLSVRPADAKPRGNSGLPPGPGNPLAALQVEIDQIKAALNAPATMWIEHLDFLSGDTTDVTTSFNSTNSGVGSGLAGLIIHSSSTGDVFPLGGNKVVEKAIQVPPHFTITGVRLCYEWSAGATSHISQIRLSQVQDPPSTALILLDDATAQPNAGPVCVDSAAPATPIDPSLGAVLLSLRLNIGATTDTLVLRGVALHLVPSAL